VRQDDLIIRSGYVVTMDPGLGDLPDGDVLVTGGRTAAVGTGLDAAGARELDARGMIVAPGLVNTHWHLWNTLLRSMSGGMPGEDRPAGYFSVSLGLGQAFTDQDNYQGTLLACAEAINSGITTVHEWSHNVRGPAHAEAELRALAEAGLRARYSYGYSAGHPNDQVMDTGGLRALHRDWKAGAWAAATRPCGCRPGFTSGRWPWPASWASRSPCTPPGRRPRPGRSPRGPARAGPAGGAREQCHPGARQALALGTIEGARSLGLDGVTGSLTPGKRADLILVATGHPNLGVLTDPAGLLVTAAQPGNVDTVLADGRILKRGGSLVTLDGERISAQALALARVRARAA
jgi:cytosine/adenosine deaminase-related metal-dependent hydrolase